MKQNNTFSVLIAEDEPIILNNIAKKVTKASPHIQIVGKASSGLDALEILKHSPADILITDIEMPGLSGLGLIEQVRKSFPKVRIIILSGYSNFEYARTALRFGVEDYLLKPVEQETLSTLLGALCAQIEEEKKQNGREVLSLALNHSMESDIPYMFSEGGFLLFHITLGNLLPVSEEVSLLSSVNFESLWQKTDFTQCFQNNKEVEHLWLIDEHDPMQKFLILHMDETYFSAEYFCLILKKYLTACFNDLPFFVICGRDLVPYQELWKTSRMLRSLTQNLERPFVQDAVIAPGPEDRQSSQREAVLKDIQILFTLNNEPAFLQCICRMLPDIIECPPAVFHQCIHLVYEAMHSSFQISRQECSRAETAFCSRIPSMITPDECISVLTASLKGLWQNASSHYSGSTLCFRIAEYMEKNFRQQISMTDLSERFGYTPSYINRLFKKEYSTSPIQYQTVLRISRAKEILLKNPDINIKSVAQSVGYEDSRYFSRIFKNETGMTPSAWVVDQQNMSDK